MWRRIYPHAVLFIFANIILKVTCKGDGSLTFLIDDTGSMSDDIRQVRSSVNRISDIVFNEKSSLIGNMVLVTFNDPDATVRAVTQDRNTFKSRLDAVYAHNIVNRDCWEPSMNGLLLALETSNRDSYIYVFTDAPAKDYRDSHYVKEMCQKKQSQIVFVLTGRCYDVYGAEPFDVYFDIAHACSGLAFDVTKSGVEEVLRTIEETIKGNKTVITTTIVPAGVKKDIPFTIDDHTDYAIVSVSGKNVYLDIKGPSANLEKIMWNDNGKVAKLSNAKPGTYVATVMGQTRTSVVIVGRTDFFFSHGFSEQKPKSLGETSLQPIAESKVHLSISVTDDHHSVQIVSAQILNMDEKPIQDPLPLKEISKDFYVTNLFVAPSQRFKVAVNGVVKATGKPIRRIGKIPITPPEPPKKLPNNRRPTVKIAEGERIVIEYNSTMKLTCKVVAFPEPKIEWANMEGRVMPSKMSLVEYPYNYISYMDISYASKGDRYKCYASNDVGRDEKGISVIVKEPFTVKSAPSGIRKLAYGTEGTITCDITSHLPMDIHWYYANEMTGQTREIETSDKYEVSASRTLLKIKKMDFDLDGRYTCKVALKNKKDVQKSFHTRVKIDGLIAPKVQGATEIKVAKGKTAVFECKVVSGIPAPKITWLFGGKSGSTFTPIGSESVLRVTNVEDKHAGKYKCVAENVVSKAEHLTSLFVQDLPKITTSSSIIYQATEGDALLKIPCVATGMPKPVIIWKLSGRDITPNAKYSIEDGTLLIRGPTVSDTNSYLCEAWNEVGAVRATFKTYIRQAPKVSGVTAKKVKLGSATSIECRIEGEPKPTITWQFMGNSSSNFSSIPGADKVLYISRVEKKHAGRYKCVAQNNVGKNEHITKLEVQDEPKIFSSVPTIYQGIEGFALLGIPCVAVGLPKPVITWKLNNRAINPSAKYSMEEGTLIIRNVTVSDTNSYTCEAKNEVGAVSATFKTYIRQLPKLSGVATKNVRMGNPASIECMIVKGEPKPKITWQYMDKSATYFVPIAGSETTLRITNVEKKHAGRYKCVAQNNVGSDDHITKLIVEYAPVITTNSSTVEGIEGDLALRIPCDALGIPKPVITWKLKGATITPGAKYSIEDGALVIMKPTGKDTSSYTCEARNQISSVSVKFQAKVDKYPKSYGTEHYVYLKQGETKKLECEAYNSKSQSVKWFITRQIHHLSTTSSRPDLESSTASSKDASTTPRTITQDAGNKEHIQIGNASLYDHDGNYTCHVSDKHGNTQTHTYVVDVGIAPEFVSDHTSISNWRGDITDIKQNCDIYKNAKPMPKVQWRFNGKVLTDLNSAGVGQYICNISNVHGYVLKRFDVKSSACLITRNLKDGPYMPLILNDEGSWHKFETTRYYTIVEQEVKITLSCPSLKGTSNTFKNFPKYSKLEAICYKEDSFMIGENIYKFSDLQCTNSIQPSVIKKKVKCSTNTSELISVGYNVPDFLEAYEVCFDHKINMPLYTRIMMTVTNNNGLSAGYNWYTYPGIGYEKTERGFTCKDASSSCCYSKSQLVNAIDFNDGPAKKSTFIDPLNVIPAWRSCDTTLPLWEDVNDMVRTQLAIYTDIVVWSGTHTMQEKNGAAIPRYLWKVVRLDDDEAMAIVYINDPKPTKSDIKCKTEGVCDKYEDWFVSGNSTYCCSLPDFLKSFDIRGTDIGESMDAVLDKIEKS